MRKVVIAEDNPFVIAVLRDALVEAGYEISGVARSKRELLNIGEQHKPDFAIIDVRLSDGSNGIDAAVELADRMRIGILFATGVPERVLNPPAPVGTACLGKPFTGHELIQALEIVSHIVATGEVPMTLLPKLHLIGRARD